MTNSDIGQHGMLVKGSYIFCWDRESRYSSKNDPFSSLELN